jgi:hypothetical protein
MDPGQTGCEDRRWYRRLLVQLIFNNTKGHYTTAGGATNYTPTRADTATPITSNKTT